MNLPSKVMLGSATLYFTDKVFDAVRFHYFGDFFGADQWLADIAFAGTLAATIGLGWLILHYCLKCLRRYRNTQRNKVSQ